jgi:FdhE protein
MTAWLENHPHLAELARLHEWLEQGLGDVVGANLCVRPDDGQTQRSAPTDDALPLLHHHLLDAAAITEAGDALRHLLASLPADGLPAPFIQQCSQLREQLAQQPVAAVRLINDTVGSRHAVTLLSHFLIWKLLAKLLLPWCDALEQQLNAGGWEEPICPLCGAGPSMAQLVRTSTGRKRLLVCGCCATTWAYRRIGCPFCGNNEQSQFTLIELEDEPFRLDCCQSCQGYLKTYLGKGNEELLLADWTTLHLDALALEQGWQRRADSLYSL